MADQPQSRPEELKREIAGVERSIHDLLLYGGDPKILLNGDEVLRSRGRGKSLKIYAELERDAHVLSVISKRKRAVTAREWGVTSASDDPQDLAAADLVKAVLQHLRFDKLTKALLDAIMKGYSVVELMWDVVPGEKLGLPAGEYLVPVNYKKRAQRRFVFDLLDRPRLLTSSQGFSGEELPPRKFIVHSHGEADESPYGRGLGNALFWPVFFKRQSISFWLVFCDKFGSPTAMGTYPTGTNQEEIKKLLSTLRGISQEASIVVPQGFEAKLLEASRSGTDSYKTMCAYMDAEISKAVLGETLTTEVGSSGGNRALGEVHDKGRIELAKDDADDLSYTLQSTVVQWIIDLNYPGRKPPEVWRDFDESEDLDTTAERDEKLSRLGWRRTEESFREVYGNGYEHTAPPSPVLSDPPDPALFSEPSRLARMRSWLLKVIGFAEDDTVTRQRASIKQDQDTIAEGAGQMSRQFASLLGPRVKDLQTLLDETGDLALFAERLAELANDEPSDEVVDSIARATFAARLAGRTPRR
jgi:phage gp29-like protein